MSLGINALQNERPLMPGQRGNPDILPARDGSESLHRGFWITRFRE
jgi:hypothetical protein